MRTNRQSRFEVVTRIGLTGSGATVSNAFALNASKAPLLFITHRDHDFYVPVEDTRALRDHLVRGSSEEVCYAESSTQHAFDVYASCLLMSSSRALGHFLS